MFAAGELGRFERASFGVLIADGGSSDRLRVVIIARAPKEIPPSAPLSVLAEKGLAADSVELVESGFDRLWRRQVAEWQDKTWWVEPGSNRGNRASEGSVQHCNTLGR